VTSRPDKIETMQRPKLTDRSALNAHRRRARSEGDFLHDIALTELQERLEDVNRTFTRPAIVTGNPRFWRDAFPQAQVVSDEDVLALDPKAHDLVIHALALHWSDDPVGQLVQCRRALSDDGLFLSVCFGGETLNELRTSLAVSETRLRGGLSPRVAPMGELRDLGGLLQRAGFALPVADTIRQTVLYSDIERLFCDLRNMGERNALAARDPVSPPRRMFSQAAVEYAQHFSDPEGRLRATFDLIFLTGWAPSETQPKPLRPGSASTRLADVLGTTEFDENTNPVSDTNRSGITTK